MAFKTDYLTKYDQLNRFVKQQRDGATQGAGVGSRQRTQKMLALGEAQAEQTASAMRTSAQGVRRIFNQSDVASSRGSELSPDLQTAAMMQAIQEDFEENKPEDDYDPIKLSEDLYGKKGVQSGNVATQSYFNEPIVEGDLRGNSRAAGDVTPETQQEIVNKIVDVGSKLGMTDYEIAYTLATVRYESGFNPDASAKSTSARGLGQFVNETGKAYGLNVENQWDVDMQVQAVLEHTADNFRMAAKKGYSDDYVYALHHDGPSLSSGGLGLAKKHVMPYVPKYLKLIESFRGEE
jgi:hypothetical protein